MTITSLINEVDNESKSKPLKRYCYKCGTEMSVTKTIDFYDTESGEPIIKLKWKCPNIPTKWTFNRIHNWFKIAMFRSHSKYNTDIKGNDYRTIWDY